MTVTPSGFLSLPLGYLRLSLAGTEAETAFQAWVGAVDAEAALDLIVVCADSDPTSGLGNFAAVTWDVGLERRRESGGARSHFAGSGALRLLLHERIDPAHTEAEAAFAFLDSAGAILAQLEQLAGTAGYLDIEAVTLVSGPARPTEDQEATLAGGAFYEAEWRITYRGL